MGLSYTVWASCANCGEGKSFPVEDMSDPPYGFKWQPFENSELEPDRCLLCWGCYGE